MATSVHRLSQVLLLSCAMALLLPFSLQAASTTFSDSGGRFSIDLPDDYKLQPQTHPMVYVFKGKNGQVMILFEADESVDGSYKTMKDVAVSSSNAGPIQGKPMRMMIGKKPARLTMFTGRTRTDSGVTADMVFVVGSVALTGGAGGMFIVTAAVNAKDIDHKIFLSIRNVGEAVAPPTDLKEVQE